MNGNDFFLRICKEAMDELASGKVSFKDAPTNTLLLACFGMLYNHMISRLSKPLWFFVGAIITGIIGYFIMRILGN